VLVPGTATKTEFGVLLGDSVGVPDVSIPVKALRWPARSSAMWRRAEHRLPSLERRKPRRGADAHSFRPERRCGIDASDASCGKVSRADGGEAEDRGDLSVCHRVMRCDAKPERLHEPGEHRGASEAESNSH
jgi:hypothetical protein